VRVDVHQHLWPEQFVAALRRRHAPPCLDGWTLHLDGEPDLAIDPGAHDPLPRGRLAAADGVDLALVSLSSPLGIEWLPADEALPLLDAYHDGVAALPPPFRAWAAACLSDVDPAALRKELDRGCVGLQLPATALLDSAGYARCAPLLDLLVERDVPLFVHPGAAPARSAAADSPAGARPSAGADPSVAVGLSSGAGASVVADSAAGAGPTDGVDMPAWWAALVPYVQQLHQAWYAFRAFGRPRHPRLRVCFAALAGLAPLHNERFAARGGIAGAVDPDIYLETSSYGPRAIDAVVRALAIDVVVSGSDRPYAGPAEHRLGPAADHALHTANPQRLLALTGGRP